MPEALQAPKAPVYPFAPEWRDDPYPAYQQLIDGARVHWSEEQEAFFFTRYEDCLAILRHPASSSDMDNATRMGTRAARADSPMALIDADTMLFSDPPDHTRLRKLVSKAFTPRAVEAMAPRIQSVVSSLLDAAAERGSMDVVADLAFPLPVVVIAEMLGVPLEDQEQLKPWSADLARTIDPILTPEVVARAGMSGMMFINYLNHLIDERRARPQDDMLSRLIAVEDEGETLRHDELLLMILLLFVAGHETTQNLIGNGMLALFRHPDQMARLRDDPSLVKNAVEEMLRWDPPVQLTGRHLLEDAEFGGVVVPQGYTALTLLAAANRDPSVFDDPARFDVARPNAARNISFGHGIHHCLGAALARMEATSAIGALLQRFPAIELADPEPPHRDTFTLRGLTSLPVTL